MASIPKMMIDVDGGGPVPLDAFLQDNEFEADEISAIVGSLAKSGRYEGGGGASAEFTLTVIS